MEKFVHDMKIARVEGTLRWLEEDAPLLAVRVEDLSPQRQRSAKRFAARMIDRTRAERERLIEERTQEVSDPEFPCEPAD